MAITFDGTAGTITGLSAGGLPDGSVTGADLASTAVTDSVGQLGRRNLIINGAMQVAQRGTSTTEINNYGSVDRFKSQRSSYDNLLGTQAQVTDAPDGFGYSLKHTVTTPETTVDAGNIYRVMQYIESQNLQALKYGTSSAQDCTISFWVKGSVTGTYVFSIYADASGGSRLWTKTYTIDSANTWEYKTILIPGDTTRAIDNDNTEGLRLQWFLGAGSNYTSTDSTSWINYVSTGLAYGHSNDYATTSGATWQITGIQLEVGSVATPFEHRSYGEELALCQRYFWRLQSFSGNWSFPAVAPANQEAVHRVYYPTPMRASPSFSNNISGYSTTLSGESIRYYKGGVLTASGNTTFTLYGQTESSSMFWTNYGLSTAGDGLNFDVSSTVYFDFDAEL